MCSIEDAGEG